ncbi:uncharacterized protein LOC127766415 [Oryza glaberrima]|uniref:uncharacterized protein LOC127766415 n=1 Tax=Oryza glaberrima TaxID=4538 RepID=UPI00224C5052|nr:uncharacterized protein LOC127766415 [Oryza glaberrima]
MEDWVVLSDSDGDSVELHDGSESSFAVVHENAEISDAAESNCGHVDSKIAAAKDTTFSGEEDLDDETDDDIECFDDEIFDDEEELDDDDESLDDDDIECYDVEDKICEENPDDEIFDDEEEIDCEEDLDDDDDDCESLDDDDIECFDAEDIICEENPDDEIMSHLLT